MRIGLDVGSTTLKCVVYGEGDTPLYQEYERHYSQIPEKASGMLTRIQERFPQVQRAALCVSGSAGMGLAEDLKIPFVQEVYATRAATKKYIPTPTWSSSSGARTPRSSSSPALWKCG